MNNQRTPKFKIGEQVSFMLFEFETWKGIDCQVYPGKVEYVDYDAWSGCYRYGIYYTLGKVMHWACVPECDILALGSPRETQEHYRALKRQQVLEFCHRNNIPVNEEGDNNND